MPRPLILTTLILTAAAQAAPDPRPEPDPRFDLTAPSEIPAPPPAANRLTPNPTGQTLTIGNPDELLQQPELLHRALSSAAIAGNAQAVKLLLPVYRRLPEPKDHTLLDLAEGIAAHADGHYTRAVKHLQRAHQTMPQAVIIRLRLAQALKDDHRNLAAESHYQTLLDTDLPPEARTALQSQLDEIHNRSRWQSELNANYTRDNNINNAPSQRTVRYAGGTWILPEPQKAQGIAYNAGLARDINLPGHWRIRSETDAYGKTYWDNHPYDDHTVRTALGIAYKSGRSEAALLPYHEYRWYGGATYARENGLRAQWQRQLSERHRLITAAETGRPRHPHRPSADGRDSSLSATWVYLQSPRQYLTLGADLARKRARDPDESYRRKALRASIVRIWGKGLGTALTAVYARRKYDGAFIVPTPRSDREYTATAAIWHNRLSFRGITPRLVTVWHKTDSNIPFYTYRKANAFIQLGKTF